ncbi:MAG: hypothetical protein JSW00_11670 [Thermoplasmata archaeon]|nr:MAG: hypothetical protein JSW00_11670 [Thermoplasmata archaeon]
MLVDASRTYRSKLLVISITVILIGMGLFNFKFTIRNKGEPVGDEFQVNTYITNNQENPSVAMDPNGNFVIAWESIGQDGDGYGIYAQRYYSNGTPFDDEFLVNSYTSNIQRNPSVAMNSTGYFVIVWASWPQDGDKHGIYAKRYDSNGNELTPPSSALRGTEVGNEFRVNTYVTDSQNSPSVAMTSNGSFVISWDSWGQDGSSNGVYAQIYDASGNPAGNEFRVNAYTMGIQGSPSVAMDSTGNFTIAWDGQKDSGDYGITARRYKNNGVPIGGEIQVNTYTTDLQSNPSIAMNSTGDFVIVWYSMGQDGSGTGIYARRYNNNGNPISDEFQVNTYITDNQILPSVAMDLDGNFVITWSSYEQDGSDYGVFARQYKKDGSPIAIEFKVNTYTMSSQDEPSIGMDSNGNYVISWRSSEQDGDYYGVFAQRFNNTTILKIFDLQVLEITDKTARIYWMSNMFANSTVEYGFSPNYGQSIHNDSKMIFHNIELNGLEPGRLYHFRVASYNDSVNFNISLDFTFTTKFSIDLMPGWNMISVPLNQTNTNLATVLENISLDYDAVQWYNITDVMDPWKHSHVGKPSSLNDLTDINRFKAIWIHITNPMGVTLYINGNAPEVGYVNQITLYNGWNFVGYPSLIERPPDSSGLPAEVDMVMWYNASSGIWERWDPGSYSPDNLNLLKPAQGLWIHHTGATDVWLLEYVN